MIRKIALLCAIGSCIQAMQKEESFFDALPIIEEKKEGQPKYTDDFKLAEANIHLIALKERQLIKMRGKGHLWDEPEKHPDVYGTGLLCTIDSQLYAQYKKQPSNSFSSQINAIERAHSNLNKLLHNHGRIEASKIFTWDHDAEIKLEAKFEEFANDTLFFSITATGVGINYDQRTDEIVDEAYFQKKDFITILKAIPYILSVKILS